MNVTDLRFLADECCDSAVVRALRALGYDVLALSGAFTVIQPGYTRISKKPGSKNPGF